MGPLSGSDPGSASASGAQYWIDPRQGYNEHQGTPEYGYPGGHPPAQSVGYPHVQSHPPLQSQAVQYYQVGYPAPPQQHVQVDSRGFIVPDRSHSVSRTSSRSTGHARPRRSEGDAADFEDDAMSIHSHSSNSAAFTARILAGMGTTGAATGTSERKREMGDTLRVPGDDKARQVKSKNKDKKGKEEGGSGKKDKGKKPVSTVSSTANKDTQDRDSDGGSSRPTAWRPDLRPGDTVTDPNYPTAHGCPYCDKVYTGQHARSICRRHQMSKHGIELEVQVKKSRWDNSTCHRRSVIWLRTGSNLVTFSSVSRPQSPRK